MSLPEFFFVSCGYNFCFFNLTFPVIFVSHKYKDLSHTQTFLIILMFLKSIVDMKIETNYKVIYKQYND